MIGVTAVYASELNPPANGIGQLGDLWVTPRAIFVKGNGGWLQ